MAECYFNSNALVASLVEINTMVSIGGGNTLFGGKNGKSDTVFANSKIDMFFGSVSISVVTLVQKTTLIPTSTLPILKRWFRL